VNESILIDGFGPIPVHRPQSAAELGVIVRNAVAAGQGLYPLGGQTLLDVGLPPTKPGAAIDLTRLNQIIDYPARDMTITVQAGVTLSKLHEALAAENQWLPIDIPQPERATIGGAIATNTSGPRRYGYGTLRDYVIGISFTTDEGTEVKGGGRVVKNVAGYDLMKLHTGALGTLGIITQVTLKVKPRPEESAAVVFGCDTADLGPILDLLHTSQSRPIAVEVINPAAWQAADAGPAMNYEWILAVGFEEKRSTVAWQLSTLLAELPKTAAKAIKELRGPDVTRLWSAITGLQTRPASYYIEKANVRPSQTAAFLAKAAGADHPVHAHGLNGIVWLHTSDHRRTVTEAEDGGSLIVRRAPHEWKSFSRVWGNPSRGDFELMRQVKRTLDPNNVFNPGRLFADV
jgi:glycolate oxidase FAD binding subunit